MAPTAVRTGRTTAFVEWVLAAGAAAPVEQHAAHQVLLDTVAVAVAARDTEACRLLRSWPGSQHAGATSVWGTGEFREPSAAALLNGLAGHALDWDDASPTRWLHSGTVLWPALLAVVGPDVSGADLARGFAVGSAAFRGLSDALPLRPHYARGWHNTSTTGRLAAVVALATARRLPGEQLRRALAIATSTASGTLANFGSMTKPLHAGLAARDAVMAVDLARLGFTANDEILDDARGFLGLYGDADAETGDLTTLLQAARSSWTQDFAIKRYPSCYATQRAIDAARSLRERLDTEVQSVHVYVEPQGLLPLRAQLPNTPLEAKFSLEHTVALALLDGAVRLSDFTPEGVQRDDVRALAARITTEETDTPPLGEPTTEPAATLVVRTVSGREFTERVDHAHGDARNPLDDASLLEKFAEATSLPPDRAAAWAFDLGSLLRSGDLSSAQTILAGPDPA